MVALSCLGNGYFQLIYQKAWRHYILGSCNIVHRGIEPHILLDLYDWLPLRPKIHSLYFPGVGNANKIR